MSVQATTAVWCHSQAAGNERLVLLALADHAHPDGTNARPGMKTLAAMTLISMRSVRRHLHALVERAEIIVTEQPAPGRVTEYRIALPGLGDRLATVKDQETSQRGTPGVATVAKTGSSGGQNASSSPLIEPTEPIEPTTASFDKFWENYPRRNGDKGSKKNALTAWKRLSAEKRVAAVEALPLYARVANGFTKDAERYLRGEVWEGIEEPSVDLTKDPNSARSSFPLIRDLEL